MVLLSDAFRNDRCRVVSVDGVIIPAISVLSAIEGLEVATPALKPYVIPITLAVLVGFYMVQRRGTAGIGRWFGPIVLVWFRSLAIMGVLNIIGNPAILAAFNPFHALHFMLHNGWFAFIALGALLLSHPNAVSNPFFQQLGS